MSRMSVVVPPSEAQEPQTSDAPDRTNLPPIGITRYRDEMTAPQLRQLAHGEEEAGFRKLGSSGNVLGFGKLAALSASEGLAFPVVLEVEVYKNNNAFRHVTAYDRHETNCSIFLNIYDKRDGSQLGSFSIVPVVRAADLVDAKPNTSISGLTGNFSFSPASFARAIQEAALDRRVRGDPIELPSERVEAAMSKIRNDRTKEILSRDGLPMGNLAGGEHLHSALEQLDLLAGLRVLAKCPELPALVEAARCGDSWGDLLYRSQSVSVTAGGLRGASR